MSRLEVVILGSGVWGDDTSFPPSVLVDINNTLVLFDCGEGIRFRIHDAGYDVTDIQHIAITEIHPDHCALPQFYQAVHCKGIQKKSRRKKEICIYAPGQIKNAWPIVWNSMLPESQGKPEYAFPQLKWNVMKDGSAKQHNEFTLRAFNAWHGFGKVETLVYRLEHNRKTITYVGDTGPCDGLLKAARNTDLLVCEASAPIGEQNHQYGHLNPYEVGDCAKRAKVKHLVVMHHFGVNTQDEIKSEIERSGFEEKITIAKDLMKIIANLLNFGTFNTVKTREDKE